MKCAAARHYDVVRTESLRPQHPISQLTGTQFDRLSPTDPGAVPETVRRENWCPPPLQEWDVFQTQTCETAQKQARF